MGRALTKTLRTAGAVSYANIVQMVKNMLQNKN